jgi:hypothetical protein
VVVVAIKMLYVEDVMATRPRPGTRRRAKAAKGDDSPAPRNTCGTHRRFGVPPAAWRHAARPIVVPSSVPPRIEVVFSSEARCCSRRAAANAASCPRRVRAARSRQLLVVSVKINFQPPAPVPAGYVADVGTTYRDQGNGFTYGWDLANTAYRDRNASLSRPALRHAHHTQLTATAPGR